MPRPPRPPRRAKDIRPGEHEPAAKAKKASPVPISARTSLPLRKKLAFASVPAILFFVLLEAGLWLLGVSPSARTRDAYAGFTPHSPHFSESPGPGDARIVTVSANKKDVLNPIRFPAGKPARTYRIACLGGSSTYGRPFFDATSYPGFLRAFLPSADPSKDWEVINAGAISYASYRVLGLLDELARYDVDLFVIDVGHNEFLERRTYDQVFRTPSLIRTAAGLVSRTRTATLLGRLIQAVGIVPTNSRSGQVGLDDEVIRIPLNAVGPEAYHRDEAFRLEVLKHLESSLERMIDRATAAGARVILVAPASNLRDFAPIKSEHSQGLPPARLAAWRQAFEIGRAHANRAEWSKAVDAYATALAIDPRHAELWFRNGQALWALDRFDEATHAFQRARDEDICPLRSLGATTELIREVARERHVKLLDFESELAAHSPHGAPGEEAFADHVHMQVAANERLALDLLDALTEVGVLHPSSSWNTQAIDAARDRVMATVDRGAMARELRSLSQLLDYLDQPEQALHRVQEAMSLLGHDDAESLALAGNYLMKLGKAAEAETAFRKAFAADPDFPPVREALGGMVLDQGHPREALSLLEPVLRASPSSVPLLNRVGVAQAQLGENRQAIATFQHALRLSPNDAAIHANLALALERVASTAEAVLHYREALRLDPTYTAAREGLARLGARP